MVNKLLTKEGLLLGLVIAIGVAGRLIPHIPNATSMISLSLFVGFCFTRFNAALITVLIALISNAILSWLFGYPMLGSWLVFMLSGLVLVSLFGQKLQPFNWGSLGYYAGSGVLFYWVWTNLGVFIAGGLYPHTFEGFLLCFYLAIPFLGHSLLSNLIWAPVLFGAWQKLARRNALLATR